MASRKRKPARKKRATRGSRTPSKPKKWDNAISVAYLRMVGGRDMTQLQAAKDVGVSLRTVAAWEAATWWPEAQGEARARWLNGCERAAMRGVLLGMGDPNEYAQMSRYAADRLIPELAPPKQRKEFSGPDGGPIRHDLSKLTDEELDLAEQLLEKSSLDTDADSD